MDIEKLFVYGTLRPGQRLFQQIDKYVINHFPAFAHGRLFVDSPIVTFPKAFFSETERFKHLPDGQSYFFYGDILEIPSVILEFTDLMEGVPFLYERIETKAYSELGIEYKVFAYEYAHPYILHLEELIGGSFTQ